MKFKISATLKGPGGVPGAGFEKLLDHTGVPKLRVWVCRYGMKANATRVSDMLYGSMLIVR